MGPWAFYYIILSTFIGLGLHPSSGNLIAEHLEFVEGLETYDYFGPANFFNLNIGYHTEHHDFP